MYDPDYDGDYDEPRLEESPYELEYERPLSVKKDDKKKAETFLKVTKNYIKEIFNDDSDITELKKEIYLISIKKLDLEFKTSVLDLEDMKAILNLIKDVYNLGVENEKTPNIDRLLRGIEGIQSANIVKHKSSECISFVFIFNEPLVSGGTRNTRKFVLTLNTFKNVTYEYAVKNELIKISVEDLLKLHEKLLGKTIYDGIKDYALVYAMITESLSEHFEENDLRVEFNFNGPIGTSMASYYNPINNLFDYVGFYDARLSGSLSDYYNFDSRDESVDEPDEGMSDVQEVDFSSIYGLDLIKSELTLLGDSIKYKYDTKNKDIEIPKGVLLIGAPGTGKTFITKAFAKQYGFNLMYLSNFVGNSGSVDSSSIKKCLRSAKEISRYNPTIVFIDEIDKIITRNNEQVMATLLEGLSTDGNFLIIGACNHEEGLPKPLTRPGRFDKKLYFSDLSTESKISIFNKILDKKGIDRKNIDMVSIIDYLPSNITVATMDAIAKQAKIIKTVLKEEIDTIKIINISESLVEGISDSVRPDDISMQRTAWHEAGHAAMGLLLGKKITLATIKPTYKYLGYVMFKYQDDKILTYEDFIKDIKVDIGGWAAEKIIFKDLSVGAGYDFRNMQNTINFLTTYTGDAGTHLISTDPGLSINFSIKERNDMYRVKKYKTKGYVKGALKLLKKNKILLNRIYQLLMEKERVTGDELEKLYESYRKETN